MLNLFKNIWLVSGIIIYIASLAILFRSENYSVEEAVFALLILGFFFSAVAWFTTKRAETLEFSIDPSVKEMLFLMGYIGFVFLYLIFGVSVVDSLLPKVWIENPQIFFVVKIVKKLLVFVVIPILMLGKLFGYSAKDFGFRKDAFTEFFKSHLWVVIVVSFLLILLQYFVGNAAQPIRQGEFSSRQIIFAVPICFTFLFIEVGLVEEIFYRVILQSRFAAFFRSEIAGIVIVGIVFAVSHVPGLIFRQAGAADGLSTTPNALETVAYTISTISLISIMFGIIWVRTRNLLVLIFIHAATDLLPNLSEFIKIWNL